MNNKSVPKRSFIFVTGFFGAPIEKVARETAEAQHMGFVSLDDEIKKSDGRSVKRICMTMGEHEYRNKEYEALTKLLEGALPAVVACSDGVLYDDMSRELISKHGLIIAGAEMSREQLWENALLCDDTCHAFMYFGSDEQKREAFFRLYERQKILFSRYL